MDVSKRSSPQDKREEQERNGLVPCRVKGVPDKYSAPRFFAGKAEVRSDRRFTREKIVSRFETFDTTDDRDPRTRTHMH